MEDDDIQTRLKETSQNCLDAYLAWDKNRQDPKSQEVLHAAIHESRKVSSRLEIDLAVSEREKITSKPIPIPAHRSNSKGDTGALLEPGADTNSGPIIQSKPKRRRPPRKPTGQQ